AIDLFAGSANTLHWMARHAGARHAIAFELDDAVFALTRTNLSAVGLDIDRRRHHERSRPAQAAVRDPDPRDRRARLARRTDRPLPLVRDDDLRPQHSRPERRLARGHARLDARLTGQRRGRASRSAAAT